jgi:ABC-2 type transport system ATP-binding protein
LLRDEGATVFLTTHNMEEATKLCDNVALLNEGIIVEYGRPEEICRKHNSQNIITILCKDGTVVSFPNHRKSADTISTYFKEDRVAAIHSSEPNLETVFIAVTGRTLT